jgi:signal transduction histidine kinase
LIGTVVLLVLAMIAAAVLAYQAWDAARSERRTAVNTLRDYAAFADWELTLQTKNALLTTIVTSLSSQASQVDPAHLASTVLSPAEVEDVARGMVDWCKCLSGTRYFFRYDWKDGTLRTTDTDLPDADLAWARDTMVAYVKALPPTKDRRILAFRLPDARVGPFRNLSVLLTGDSYAMLLGRPGGRPTLLVFAVARDIAHGQPAVVYGYATDPAPFVSATIRGVRGSQNGGATALLPASLVHGLSPDSILSISVTTPAGAEVYKSPGWVAPDYTAADTTEPNFGRLVLRVSLRPEMADQLVVGGLPSSHVPMLVALFLIAAGLLTVALLQLRRQQELARLRTEFVSGVSHELRTPLAQIRWFAELLRLGRLRSDDERERSAGIIDQEARRLTYLVENVLNFSRSEKGTNRVSPAPGRLDDEIRDAVELFAPLARARQMTIRAALAADVTLPVDRDALRQVLLNLLDNAVKYGPAGQTITVGSEAAQDRARVWVEDEGPGIPHADRQRVWEPYVRLARSQEAATGGSGIGLSVVRELVALHGGQTRVEGTPGGGARIVIELPLRGASVAGAPAAGGAPGAPKPADANLERIEYS